MEPLPFYLLLTLAFGAGNGYQFSTYYDTVLGSRTPLVDIMKNSGQKNFHIAFTLGGTTVCEPTWGGLAPLNDPSIITPLREVMSLGGNVVISSGGALGPYLESSCNSASALADAYLKVLEATGSRHLDIDIESPFNFDNMNTALAAVQQKNPNLTVSFTLEVMGDDYGMTDVLGVDVLTNAAKHGVRLDFVSVMAMEYPVHGDYGGSVIKVAEATLAQIKKVWPLKPDAELKGMLGITPMIGRNFNGQIFTIDAARKVGDWAKANGIGLIAFWSMERDNGVCSEGVLSPTCSGISQERYAFTKVFQSYADNYFL